MGTSPRVLASTATASARDRSQTDETVVLLSFRSSLILGCKVVAGGLHGKRLDRTDVRKIRKQLNIPPFHGRPG
ncbi:MAG: hypothetical protein BJ554DRAFT_411 [Olpidium bornovanus]|uniref:Uncharacterized protein n=1 Tax=Olpidium bornovanus TaxID=278681 RepID=A0A8H8DI75_9FUNG|nr:MAG: hypothetical protein BJ554DRAFT_411 [Olpidium bornovanus]